MANKGLYFVENREKLKDKIFEFCDYHNEIDNDKIDVYHSEEDNQISIWLFASDYVYGSFDNACNELFSYIEDELNIVCYDIRMEDDDTYLIIIFYDEISNESENIISEILDVLNKYNKKIDIQYDDDSAYISWY